MYIKLFCLSANKHEGEVYMVDTIIEKFSSYNILNYILPGIVFSIFSNKVFVFSLTSNNILENVFLYYFYGLILSRIGSLVVEPIFKKIKLITFAKYEDYIEAEKKDEKLSVLSESNNMYRTLISTFITLLLLYSINILIKKFYINECVFYLIV